MSATPVTVTVRSEFQFDEVNTSCEALSPVMPVLNESGPSLVSDELIVIVTLSVVASPEGALERRTVKVASTPFSSVSPEIAET